MLRFDSGPPLFYLLENPFVLTAEALGLPDWTVRLLPFLALALLFVGARSLPPGGSRRRFLWLAASSPLFLLYSAEARSYALLALAGFLLFLTVVRDAPGIRGFVAVALAAALALWTHYLALFLLASLLLAALCQGRRQSALALGAGVGLFLPWSPILYAQPQAATAWMREPVRTSAVGFLAALGGGGRIPSPLGVPLPEPLFWLACAAAVALLGCLAALRGGDAQTRMGVAAVLLTLGGVLAVSFWRPAAFAGRSEMAVLPIWLWSIARAGERSRGLSRGAVAVAAIGIVSSLLLIAAPHRTRPSAALLAGLERSAHAGDLVVATVNFYLPARLERDRGGLAADLRAFPADLAEHPGWFLPRRPSDEDDRGLADQISRLDSRRTVFLLLDPPYWTPHLERLLLARGPIQPASVLPDAVLVVSPGR